MNISWDEACLLTNNHLQDPSIPILSIVCGYLVVGASRLMWKSIPYYCLSVRIWVVIKYSKGL